MFNLNSKGRKVLVVSVVVLAIAFLGSIAVLESGQFGSSYNPNGGSSYTILGLSHVQVLQDNSGNYSGYYWLGQILLDSGPVNLATSSTSIANSTGNITGNSQIDNLNTYVVKNQYNYTASSTGGIIQLTTYQQNTYQGTYSYTNCNGQSININPGQSTIPSGCLNPFPPVSNQQAFSNYATACSTAVKASNSSWIPLTGFQSGGSFGGSVTCQYISQKAWGTIYESLNPVAYQKVYVSIRGIPLTIDSNNNQATHLNSSNKVDLQVKLLYPTTGTGAPDIGYALVYTNRSKQTILINQDSLSTAQNLANNMTKAINEYICERNTLISCSYNPSPVSLQGINNQLTGQIFQQSQNQYNISLVNVSGSKEFILNDPTFQKINPPTVLITAGFAVMGFSISKAQCSIQPISPIQFRSSSNGFVIVNVKNTGAGGSCIVSSTQSSPIIQISGSQSKYIDPGQTKSFNFSITTTVALQTNATTQYTFQACDSATQTSCTTTTGTAKVLQTCQNGGILNGSSCRSLTTVTVPTTTVCQSGQCNATTTIGPSNTCPDPNTVFNQTLYNEHIIPPCSLKPNSTLNIPPIIYIAVILGIAGASYYLYRRGKKGRKR